MEIVGVPWKSDFLSHTHYSSMWLILGFFNGGGCVGSLISYDISLENYIVACKVAFTTVKEYTQNVRGSDGILGTFLTTFNISYNGIIRGPEGIDNIIL